MASLTDPVILYLTAMWTAALTGVNVVDGPQVTSDAADDWLFVGYNGDTPDEYNEGATGQQSLMAFAKVKGDDGQVICAIVSRNGDSNVVATRARANGVLSTAEAAVRADMQLGGLVMQAYISDYRYSPVQTKAGAKVRVVFTVTYKAQLI
jgi:Na+(H+)/acetate symporter ActP